MLVPIKNYHTMMTVGVFCQKMTIIAYIISDLQVFYSALISLQNQLINKSCLTIVFLAIYEVYIINKQ